MKKITSFIISALALSCVVLPCGCQNQTEEAGVLWHGFNSYEAARDYTYEEWFGKVEVNTDKKYVTEGDASLKVYPMADFDKPTEYPYVSVNTMGKDVLTSDFSGYSSISLDVYNPNETSVGIALCLHVNADVVTSTRLQHYTLAAESWTRVEYSLDSGAVKYVGAQLKDVACVTVAFKDKRTSLEDSYKPLYLDNLRAYTGETKTFDVSVNTDGVFLGFEDDAQADVFDYLWSTKYSCYMMDGNINVDRRFVTQGEKSLKLTLRPDFLDSRNYLGVKLYKSVLEKVFQGKTSFSFDVINACQTEQTMTVEYKVGNVTTKENVRLAAGERYTHTVTADNLSSVTQLSITFPTEFTMSNAGENKVFYLDAFKVA